MSLAHIMILVRPSENARPSHVIENEIVQQVATTVCVQADSKLTKVLKMPKNVKIVRNLHSPR